MANSRYLIHNKGKDQSERALQWLFGFPTAVALAFGLYGVFATHATYGMLLIFCGLIWLIVFDLAGKLMDPAAAASGVRGESKVKTWLESLPNRYVLFDRVRLPHEGSQTGERELDFIVIGKRCVFVIEVKNNAGTIAPNDLWDKQWPVKTPSGGRRLMRNPMHQVYGQRKTLEERLAEHGVYLTVQPIVVLSNPDCSFFWNEYSSIPIVQSESALNEVITQLDGQGREIDAQRIAELIRRIDIARRRSKKASS